MRFLTIILILLPFHAFGDITISGKTITDDQLKKIAAALPKTTEDKVFYHWAKEPERAFRWIKQGALDQGEVDFFNTPSGDRQIYGGGVYLAESSTSSISYGDYAVAFEVKKGSLQYDSKVVQSVLGYGLDGQDATELGRHIPFLRNVTSDWWIASNAEHTQHIVSAAKYGVAKQGYPTTIQLTNALRELAQADGHNFGYADSYVALSRYQDGISFIRSVQANKNDPWFEFDSLNFEPYRNTRARLYSEALGDTNKFGIGTGSKIKPPNMDTETWVESQVKFLKEIYLGTSGGNITQWRTGEVVAKKTEGSSKAFVDFKADKNGHSFLNMSDGQVKVLADNPYLEVFSIDVPDKPGLKHAVYSYKSALTVLDNPDDPVRNELSSEFKKRLESIDKAKLSKPEVEKLNQDMVDDLLRQTLRKHANDQITDTDLWKDLISIHPGPDFNGRTVRLYRDLAYIGAKVDPPFGVMTDLDIVIPRKTYDKIEMDASKAYEKWVASIIEEATQAKLQRRPARLHDVSLVNKMQSGMSNSFLASVFSNLDGEDLHLVQQRDFEVLLRKKMGPQWDVLYSFKIEDFLNGDSHFMGLYEQSPEVKKLVNTSVDNFLKQALKGDYGDVSSFDPGSTSPKVKDLLWERLKAIGPPPNSLTADQLILKLSVDKTDKVDLDKVKPFFSREKMLGYTMVHHPDKVLENFSNAEVEGILKATFVDGKHPEEQKIFKTALGGDIKPSTKAIIADINDSKIFAAIASNVNLPAEVILERYEKRGGSDVLPSLVKTHKRQLLDYLKSSKRFETDPNRTKMLYAILQAHEKEVLGRPSYSKNDQAVFTREIIAELKKAGVNDARGGALARRFVRAGNLDAKYLFPENATPEDKVKILRRELKLISAKEASSVDYDAAREPTWSYKRKVLELVPHTKEGSELIESYWNLQFLKNIKSGNDLSKQIDKLVSQLGEVPRISDKTARLILNADDTQSGKRPLFPLLKSLAGDGEALTGNRLTLARILVERSNDVNFAQYPNKAETYIKALLKLAKDDEGKRDSYKSQIVEMIIKDRDRYEVESKKNLYGLSSFYKDLDETVYREIYELVKDDKNSLEELLKISNFRRTNLDRLIVSGKMDNVSLYGPFSGKMSEKLLDILVQNPAIRKKYPSLILQIETQHIRNAMIKDPDFLDRYMAALPRGHEQEKIKDRIVSWIKSPVNPPLKKESQAALKSAIDMTMRNAERPSDKTIQSMKSAVKSISDPTFKWGDILDERKGTWQREIAQATVGTKGWHTNYSIYEYIRDKNAWSAEDKSLARLFASNSKERFLRKKVKETLKIREILEANGISEVKSANVPKVAEVIYAGNLKGRDLDELPLGVKSEVETRIRADLPKLSPEQKKGLASTVNNGLDLKFRSDWEKQEYLKHLEKELSWKKKRQLKNKVSGAFECLEYVTDKLFDWW